MRFRLSQESNGNRKLTVTGNSPCARRRCAGGTCRTVDDPAPHRRHPDGVLYDKARIFVQGGAGGNGCLTFRREAHVPKGGPDGGDGGHGGDVVLVCDDSLRDLQTFKRKAHYKAGRGAPRRGRAAPRRRGRATLVVRVPPGTQVTLRGRHVYDLVAPGQRVVVASGGLGGRGNKHFATPTRQAPRFAERGLPGEEGWIDLRLKLLADVGLVGLPNAGKSSLLAPHDARGAEDRRLPVHDARARARHARRRRPPARVADIPGLIEGASEGAGLGHEFLAHVERTRLLVHVLELAPLDGSDPDENFATIEAELAGYDARLATLPRILALSKADLVPAEDAEAARAAWRERLGDDVPVLVTSSATGEGLDELRGELLRARPRDAPRAAAEASPRPRRSPSTASSAPPPSAASRSSASATARSASAGRASSGCSQRFDVENEEAAAHVEQRLDRMGVIQALEDAGLRAGRRGGDRRHRARAGPVVMSPTVVKLGSSIIADDDGDAARRRPARRSATRSRAPARRRRSSRAARSRAACASWTSPRRPTAIADLQAAQRGRAGQALPRLRRAAARARRIAAPRCCSRSTTCASARTTSTRARRCSRLLDWRVVPVINENDTTATDEISFGDNDFLAAQVAVLLGAERLVLLTNTDGLYTANPRTDAGARLVARSTDPARARGAGDRPGDLGARHRRDALEGRRGRDGDRGRDPDDDLQRAAPRRARRARSRASPRARASRRRRADLVVQALAQVRQARPRAASSSTRAPRGRCATAGPRCCRSASSTCAATSTPATRSRS